MIKQKIVIAITGASGAIYAKQLLAKLQLLHQYIEDVAVIMSDNAKQVWQYEIGDDSYTTISYKIYKKDDFMAPFASGSSSYKSMIICPCSMGTLARIATGISNDLTTRAADVMLKERRKLVLVTRDTPLNLIHLKNMQAVTEAGAIVCPASPSFYSKPQNFNELANTVVDRVIDLIGLPNNTYRWNELNK